MIIDAHTHVHPEKNGLGDRYDASPENLIRCMEDAAIDKAVILPIAPMVSNQFIWECCQRYPDKLIGFASVNPLDGIKAVEKLEEDIYKYKLKGLKLHPRLQNFKINEPSIVPVIQKAADLKIPIVIDTLLHGPGLLKDNEPLLVDELARVVPKAKIVMAHMGGYKFMDALFVAKVNKNIYLDLSITLTYFSDSPFEEQINFVIKQVGAERCIYGSDHPEHIANKTLDTSIKLLEKYRLKETEIEYILGQTIASLI